MKKTSLGLLLIVLALSALPVVSSAQADQNEPNKKVIKEKSIRDDKKELKQELRDATTTADRKEIKQEIKQEDRLIKLRQLANTLAVKLTREVRQVRNLANRLLGENSIVAKLEARGQNVTAIKAKLGEAKVLADKAQTAIDEAKASVTGQTATSTQALKARMADVHKMFKTANDLVKQASAKIKEARKLIAQIPGIRQIETATSTPASTATSTN